MRAKNSGFYISEKDASIIKGMIKRGDRMHDIASWFGVNSARISEIKKGQKFLKILTTNDNLPPPGPYLSGIDIMVVKKRILDFQELFNKVEKNLKTKNNLYDVSLVNNFMLLSSKLKHILKKLND